MNNYFVGFSLLVLLAALVLMAFQTPTTDRNMSFSDNYEERWKQIDSLEQKGLPQSALKEVEALYEQANNEDNQPQRIKALIYINKYKTRLEEDGLVKAIGRLTEQVETEEGAPKAILQSLLAELYTKYLNDNIWRMRERTSIQDFVPTDVATWTVENLTDESARLYLASVRAELQQVPKSAFEALWVKGKYNEKLRPTLYDLLAHRAIDYFLISRSYLTEPRNAFRFDQAEAFAPADTFAQAAFETPDSSARKYRALQLFQEVLAFRLSEKNTPALVDADLKRFQFGYQQSTNSLKDTLFLQALQALNDQLAGDSAQSEVQLALAKYYIQQGNTHDVGSTDPSTRWAYKTAFDILTEVEKSYPNSFAAKQVNSLKGQIKQKQLEVKLEEVILPAQPALVQVSYRNISSTKLRLVRISPEEYWEWEQMNQNQKYAFIAEKSVVKDLQITPPDPKDYHRHRTEIILEPLPLGYYVLAIAENGDFASQQEARGMAVFQVSRLAALKRQMRGQQSGLLVVDRTEGNPLPEVNVKAYKQSYNRRKRASEWDEQLDTRSARNGFANLNLDNNGRYKILLSRGEDRLYIDNYYGRGYYNYQAEPRLITHFFLDRAIYRPGQTVYFKALVYQYKPKEIPVIAPGQIIEIGFFNVNNEEVATLELKTNEYGTVEGSFQIPQGGLTGGMSLQSSTEDEHYFRVEEYKRPKFEAQLLPIEGDYALGDTVTATGNAMTFAGAPLDGATVQYRVVREVRYPWWPWWRYGRITPRSQSAKEITFGETKTDEKGNFNIPFQALADPSADSERNPAFTFKVYAAVVDITGETHTAITTIKLADLGLEATIDFPETADISDLPDLQIVVKNLNSQVTNTGGKLVVHRLQAPERYYLSRYWELPDQPSIDAATFRKNFPLLAFKNEDKAINWPVQRTELTATVDSFQNLSAIDMSNWPVGFYRMEVEVQDKNGNAITTQHTFSLYNSSKKQAPPAQLNWATITKKQGEPGQTLPLWLSSAANQQIYYELESRAGIEAQKWIDVGDWEEEQIKIKEAYRGNILVHLRSVRHNRHWQETITLNIPWSNKDLSFEWQAFRDKLKPGAEEEWTLIVKGAKKDQLAAELVASLYDASLDQFVTDSWQRIGFPMVQRELQWTPYGFSTTQGYVWAQAWQQRIRLLSRSYDELDWFNWFGGRIRGSAPMPFSRSNAEFEDQSAPMAAPMGKRSSDEVQIESAGAVNMMSVDNTSGELDEVVVTGYSQQEAAAASEGQIRTNLNETVFFYPTLRTDKDGNVRIKFTMNEALTRWKFQAFAHTKELDDGIFTDEVVTQKELMIMPNPPRFVRESDQLEYTAKVVNLSEQALSGTAKLDLFDASNMQEVNALLGLASNEVSFQVEGNQSTLVSWKLTVPKGKLTALTHRASAQAGNFSDAEESTLPVLTNRMLVTESIPMAVKGNSTETFTFESLKKASTSSTLDHHQFTLEYTSNPAWYAVQALPYLMEYPHDCTEQIFSRYYANTLASSIANRYPKIKRVYESWRAAGQLESNLTKNQDLKAVLLEETPWVLDAQSEAEQKARIALLFDLNRMSNEQDVALSTLVERQAQNGGFSWFPGGRESWYITQHLVEGFGRLQALTGEELTTDKQVQTMIRKSVQFIDEEFLYFYKKLKERTNNDRLDFSKDNLSNLVIHYLYARQYFQEVRMSDAVQEAHSYFIGQAKKYWLQRGIYQQGLLAIALSGNKEQRSALEIVRSLKERALVHPELGMYWKYQTGYFWYQLPVETQSLMVQVFAEVAQDEAAVEQLKIWLLKNKQTNHWKTTKATANAVYSLLHFGANWLAEDQPATISFPKLSSGSASAKITQAQRTAEAGTGYFQVDWKKQEVSPKLAEIKVTNPNKSISWGAAYWQYFEDLDQIKTFEETPLTIKKEVFKTVNTNNGPQLQALSTGASLQPGDQLTIRIEVRVDRPMEYVHLKDMRASGLEPMNVLSRYKWQDGLGYYESTKDVATHFFMDYLPKGTFVFEYPLRVTHKGDFSNGITTMQSMYAPEFTSHSQGIRLQVE